MSFVSIIKKDFSYLYEAESIVVLDFHEQDTVDIDQLEKSVNKFVQKVKILQHKINGSPADKGPRGEAMESLIAVCKDVLGDYASVIGSKHEMNKMFNEVNNKMFAYYNKNYGV
jgi:hypothetical protein